MSIRQRRGYYFELYDKNKVLILESGSLKPRTPQKLTLPMIMKGMFLLLKTIQAVLKNI